MNPIIRNIALKVPPLRRMYEFGMSHAKGHMESQAHLAQMKQRHEALELEMYVMRSDLQRAAVRNESLVAELAAKADQVRDSDLLRTIIDLVRNTQAAALDAARHAGSAATSAELSLYFGKLAGKLTMFESKSTARSAAGGGDSGERQAELYLDLLEQTLTGVLWEDEPMDPWSKAYDPEVRAIGRDWPRKAWTMIGSARLRNFRKIIETVLAERVPGDILEAGVWRGGACILARGVLAAHNVTDRRVWVADSFEGLPPPDARYPADAGDAHSTFDQLKVSEDMVKEAFARFGLLDDQVRFLRGWFEHTLPGAPIEALSVLRLDGDMYSSTIQTLEALYAKVSVGGFVIVDDYILKGCQRAVDDFRQKLAISDPLVDIDGAAVYWRKSGPV